ncbi:MAG: flagellin, partial [Lachnospiraceae bacterium]|nr:flagellin [Lachnospiraceae bacterium]
MNIVAHNILAMNAQRMYGINTNSKKKSSEKLSSGYKINRAADDAAGLSISEKMRKRIRGLNQGADNLKDGVSLCQTADGALMEVEDMIHRINELAIKAANGTNSQSDREDINSEISELKEEMTRVFNTTKFNETYIFKAPYVPDVQGEPTDYELFNGPDGSTPAGVLINHKRYTFGELGVPSSPTADWIKEIVDPDNPDELIRLKLKAGDSPENIRRVYVMTADDTGIKVNNLYAGLWDSTIKENGK